MSENQELVRKVKALESMDLAGLQAEYERLYGVLPATKNLSALRNQLARKLNRQDIDARKKAGKGTAEKAEPEPEKVQKPKPAPESDSIVLKRIAELQGLSIPQLREEYSKRYVRPCTSRNKKFLMKKLAEAIRNEVGAEAGKVTVTAKFERKKPSRSKRVTKPVKQDAESKRASHREPGERDPRLPKPGTTLTRHYKGKDVLVRVLDDGFEYGGKQYRSLSRVAMEITGAKAINGYLFFELGDYAKPVRQGAKEKGSK